jgi:hypothetical protein
MSDDFGTVNVNRVERAREIEAIRQHHRRHREEVGKLLADAPSEHLAAGYRQLLTEIEASISKLDDLEGREPVRKSEPGMRPLVTTLPDIEEGVAYEGERDSRSRLVLIIIAAVIALALIAWLIWKASSDRRKPDAIVEEPATTSSAAATAPETVAEQPPVAPAPSTTSAALSVTPQSHDFGIIRKGTNAVRQYDVANNSDQPVTIKVERSGCKCLFYSYKALVPPKAKETVTVTVSGKLAKAGALQELVRVSTNRPNLASSFIVRATIR